MPEFIFSQRCIQIPNSSQNAGSIPEGGILHFNFNVTNNCVKTHYFLRQTFSDEYNLKFISPKINEGDTILILLEYLPKKAGSFKKNIEFYFSDSEKPILISIEGNLAVYTPDLLQQCTDFQSNKPQESYVKKQENNCFVEGYVKSQEDSTGISYATVTMKYSDGQQVAANTEANGYFTKAIKPGLMEITFNKNGFENTTVKKTITNGNNIVEVYLKPKAENEEKKINDNSESFITQIKTYAELPLEDFKPNHLVFLLDVSASMKEKNKLKKMKDALNELTLLLRPEDSISMVTFSAFPQILFESESCINKTVIKNTTDTLRAKGQTAGSKAINKAYEIAEKHQNLNGNNQIILITDGEFNIDNKTEQKIKVSKNIILSILAIEPDDEGKLFFDKIRKNTSVRIINCCKKNPEDLLIEEVKDRSRK